MRLSVGEISKLYPATIAPNPYLISVYVTFVYIGQLGYCVLLVLARSPETKVRYPLGPVVRIYALLFVA